jgi:hypothetical protein
MYVQDGGPAPGGAGRLREATAQQLQQGPLASRVHTILQDSRQPALPSSFLTFVVICLKKRAGKCRLLLLYFRVNFLQFTNID